MTFVITHKNPAYCITSTQSNPTSPLHTILHMAYVTCGLLDCQRFANYKKKIQTTLPYY